MEELLEKARVLLGWPTTQKIRQLIDRFPEKRWWDYAVGRLEKATHPNEPYLVSCLETAKAEAGRRTRQKLGPYPRGFGERDCPWDGGLYCPGAKACEDWRVCPRFETHPWLARAFEDKYGEREKRGDSRGAEAASR